MFMVGGITGGLIWWAALSSEQASYRTLRGGLGALLLAIAIYGIAGIRAYLAFFTIAAFATAAAYSVIVRAGVRQRVIDAGLHVVLIAILWVVFVGGAGPYAETYQTALFSTGASPSTAIGALDSARAGFSASGGATALDAPSESIQGGDFGSSEGQQSRVQRLVRLIRGLAMLAIPISVLSAASIVHFAGGQGLLLLTDFDTVVMDVVVLISLWLAVRSARRERMSPAMVFALVLALLVTTAMAYVVTNYGTLFRLRLMSLTPFSTLPVMIPRRGQVKTALRRSEEMDGAGHDPAAL
jgi:hypothetical protein